MEPIKNNDLFQELTTDEITEVTGGGSSEATSYTTNNPHPDSVGDRRFD